MVHRNSASFVVLVLVGSFIAPLAAVDSKKAQYIGGTISGLSEQSEGRLTTTDDTHFIFTPDKKDKPSVEIPYTSISSIEYGQKAGRRVGVAILVSPLALFSKKRKHYLTVSFADGAGKDQSAVFELGKDIIRTTLTIVETRSGKKIEYQDEEARKAGRG